MKEEKKVDITGLMVEATPGWEARVKELARAEFFQASVDLHPHLLGELTEVQIARLKVKLKLVEEAAEYMAAGMLKGTLKYPTDDVSLETWMAHVIGEGADQMNYQILLAHSFYNTMLAAAQEAAAKKDG